MNISDFLPVLYTVLMLCMLVGSIIALRSGFSQKAGETQQLAITALQAQNQVQEQESRDCKEQIAHMKRVVAAIRYGMDQQGWNIQVNGETITLVQGQAKRVRSVTIQMNNPLIDKQIDTPSPSSEEDASSS